MVSERRIGQKDHKECNRGDIVKFDINANRSWKKQLIKHLACTMRHRRQESNCADTQPHRAIERGKSRAEMHTRTKRSGMRKQTKQIRIEKSSSPARIPCQNSKEVLVHHMYS
ncbi:hypothetical protein ACFX2I_011540 [Malus domestica]